MERDPLLEEEPTKIAVHKTKSPENRKGYFCVYRKNGYGPYGTIPDAVQAANRLQRKDLLIPAQALVVEGFVLTEGRDKRLQSGSKFDVVAIVEPRERIFLGQLARKSS